MKKYQIFFLFFTLLFCTLAAYALEDNWRHWKWGLEAIKRKDYNQAKYEFGYYLRHPEMHRHMFGIAYFGRGLMFESMKRYDSALVEYTLAIKNDLHPTVKISVRAYMNMGTIYMRNKDYKEAINAYLKAVDQKPENGLAHYYLGLAYLKSGDHKNAEKEAAEAKKLGVTFTALSDKLKKAKKSSSQTKE